MRLFLRSSGLFLACGLVAVPALSPAQDKGDGKTAVRQDKVVAGSPTDFMEVRHLVLKGTNEVIGQALASVGKERYQLKPEAGSDRFRTRVQRRYIEKNYPILHERMRGVAAAFGKRLDDDAWNFSALSYLVDFPGGCSVVYYPAGVMADNTGVVSRNYEFTTGTILGTRPKPNELPVNARPYVVEMYPDRGHASLALCAFDLLSGVLDGINAEGLTVAALVDGEAIAKVGIDPPMEDGVGLDELQMLRLLLDTCATAEEAKEALLMTKQYYSGLPVHYLVADRHGQAFVWEYAHGRNREYIIQNPDKPLVVTNFSLHRHRDGKGPPSATQVKEVCPRYCTLAERIAAEPGRLTVAFIKENHKAVDATAAGAKGAPPGRTLWHALYFPEQRKMQVSFYLRDEPDPKEKGSTRIVRSDYLEFVLKSGKAIKE